MFRCLLFYRFFLLCLSITLLLLGCHSDDSPSYEGDDSEWDESSDGDLDLEAEPDIEPEAESAPTPRRCNGFTELCERRYNEVAYATSHNAMSNEQDGWVAANQYLPIPRQLQDGVRGFMLDVYLYENELHLCHGDCLFGKILLRDALQLFKDFMDENPNEICTLILESYADSDAIFAMFEQVGLSSMLFRKSEENDWPSLNEMIDAETRLVVFTDDQTSTVPDFHYVWDYCWDTPWQVMEQEDFTCRILRGDRQNELFILNHILYGAFDLPDATKAEQANSNPFFLSRAQQCQQESGQLPNFITVDFYSLGNLFDVVDALNGVQH